MPTGSIILWKGNKLLAADNQKVYLLIDRASAKVAGLLKIGPKRLFLLDHSNQQTETYPLCVLDFYVAENLQRAGHGKRLFDFMLENEGLDPR